MLSQPLHRAIREACRSTGKEATLVLRGEDVFLDCTLLEAIQTPLLHVVRNAVDHGIEDIAVREAIGKPAVGRISVTIEQRGSQVEITVEDDGRGLDVTRIREVAIKRSLLSATEAARLDEQEVYQLLLRPGFSTKEETHDAVRSGRRSGRGQHHGAQATRLADTGIDAGSRGAVRDLGPAHRGGIATADARRAGSHLCAATARRRSNCPPPSRRAGSVRWPNGVLHRRSAAHGAPSVVEPLRQTHSGDVPNRQPLLILRGASGVAIACDKLRGEAELVLRPLPIELRRLPLSTPSTAIVPSGPALFVLSPQGLLRTVGSLRMAHDARSRRRTVLVADDSITTCSLLRSVLEGGGYRVRTASDGDEALRIARSEPIDLVVSDVRMPRLDGIGLLQRLL